MRRVKAVLLEKDDAVAGAVTVVLVIALASLLLGYYVSTIVPSTMSQYEFSMDQSLISSTSAFASYLTTMKTNGIVGQIAYQNFILETNSIPIFTTPSYATLSTTSFVKNQSTSYYIYAPNVTVSGDVSPALPTTTFFGGGGLTIANGNRFYNPAYLYYQAGSVYEVTRDKNVSLEPSAIFQYSAGLNTLYLNAFQIYGSIHQSSTGSFNLQLEYSGSSTLNTTYKTTQKIAIWFYSYSAAQMFNDTVPALLNGQIKNATVSTIMTHLNPLSGWVVTFTIPKGWNVDFTISSYTVSAYVQVKS